MKRKIILFCAGVLGSALCAGFVACNEPKEPEFGLGEEIPGMEIKQATGTVVGSYSNGFGSRLVQVDEEFPIGKTIEYADFLACISLPKDGIYRNMIQVQFKLPVKIGNKISFSFREFQDEKDKDLDLFTIGNGSGNALCAPPDVPIYVITDYQILND